MGVVDPGTTTLCPIRPCRDRRSVHWSASSRSPAEETGEWPCLPVCEVMERVASQEIAKGFAVGIYNARGVHWRGEGGAQERELAAKYRNWAMKLVFDYPYVGSVLENIAASYDREAGWQDSEARVRKRLPH